MTAVDLSLRLLERLAASREPLGVSDLAREFETSKTKVHRHLQTLARHAFVQQDSLTRRYGAGIKLFMLGERLRERFDIVSAARDDMARLRDETGQAVTLPSFQAKLTFSPLRDFIPIAQMAGIPFALVAHPSVRAGSVQGLIELAKVEPGKINYASGGNGSAQQPVMELFMTEMATKFTHVPYKGAPQAAMDVVAGQVPVAFAGVPIVAEFIKDGRLRAFGVASDQRLASLPQVPTLKEQGIALRFATWVGLFAPSGTPHEIVARLSDEVVRALRAPDVIEKLGTLGFEIYGVPTEQFAQIVKADAARMADVVRRSGMKAD